MSQSLDGKHVILVDLGEQRLRLLQTHPLSGRSLRLVNEQPLDGFQLLAKVVGVIVLLEDGTDQYASNKDIKRQAKLYLDFECS